MDEKTFANKCLEWYDKQTQADAIAEELEAETVKRGKTQVVGPVRVTYSQPRKQYDYKDAAWRAGATRQMVFLHTKTSVDWRGICKMLGQKVDGVPIEGSKPTAKIKIK